MLRDVRNALDRSGKQIWRDALGFLMLASSFVVMLYLVPMT